jgi:hypothetical protein
MEKAPGKRRSNVHFRQTPKEFRSASQAQRYEHIKRNLPFRIFTYTRVKIHSAYTLVKGGVRKIKNKLPKNARRLK